MSGLLEIDCGSETEDEFDIAEAEVKREELKAKVTNMKRELRSLEQSLTELNQQIDHHKRQKQKLILVNSDKNWYSTFPWSERAIDLLKKKFGFESYLPNQLAAINVTLSKKDLIVIMPTGAGKSLIYQVPALMENGFTLVLCPLLSLIEDQMIRLNTLKINAITVNSSTPKGEAEVLYKRMKDPLSLLKIVMATGEWLRRSTKFIDVLKECHRRKLLNRIVIDEVHCCSALSHDARTDYGFLAVVRPIFSNIPYLGLTATANKQVTLDIQAILGIENSLVLTTPFKRPNIYYKAVKKPYSSQDMYVYIYNLITAKFSGQPGIIYTASINEAIKLSDYLCGQKLKAVTYRANLDTEQKTLIHRKWLNNVHQIIVATVAFGMGIDKSNVAFVIHASMPRSMEAFYQESGRAGRDGNVAHSYLLYNVYDYLKTLGTAHSALEEKRVGNVFSYCLEKKQCRRKIISNYFDDNWEQRDCAKMCDICTRDGTMWSYDISSAWNQVSQVIEHAHAFEERLTLNKVIDAWLKQGAPKLRVPTLIKPNLKKEEAEVVIGNLLNKHHLSTRKVENSYTTIFYLEVGTAPTSHVEMLAQEFYPFPRKQIILTENRD